MPPPCITTQIHLSCLWLLCRSVPVFLFLNCQTPLRNLSGPQSGGFPSWSVRLLSCFHAGCQNKLALNRWKRLAGRSPDFPPLHKCFHMDAWMIAARWDECIRCSHDWLKANFRTASELHADWPPCKENSDNTQQPGSVAAPTMSLKESSRIILFYDAAPKAFHIICVSDVVQL